MTKTQKIIIGIAGVVKLLIHLLSATIYGLHRDEYLYFDQGQHLQWGYHEVPPFTPFVGWIADLFGGSVIAIRFWPAAIGAVLVMMACKLVIDLKGSNWALLWTAVGLIGVPALLGTNALFQPVSFNQFFWFLLGYSIIQLIRTEKTRWYHVIGITIGIGLLNKYSFIFYLVATLLAVVLTPSRRFILDKRIGITFLYAILLFLPNVIWQWQHDFPVLFHMRELQESQLVHVHWGSFIGLQFLMQLGFGLFWMVALYGLWKLDVLKPFRFAGLALVFTILIIGGLSGKPYYALGAYWILFPIGALTLDLLRPKRFWKYFFLIYPFITAIPLYPLTFPMLSVNQLGQFIDSIPKELGIDARLEWEDGVVRDLPQDFADMHGWEELAQNVSKHYHQLPDSIKDNCQILAGSYGHISSLNYYKEKYNLPDIYSFNGTYLYWSPDTVSFTHQLLIDDQLYFESSWFHNHNVIDSLKHPYAREPGYIYYRYDPKGDIQTFWSETKKEILASRRGED